MARERDDNLNGRIPIYGPLLDDGDSAVVAAAVGRAFLGMGKDVATFEHGVEAALGTTKHAVAVGTGYAALHVGLLIAGVGPGDEVVVPSLAHLSDAQAILATGARPVICDIDDDTLCIDPDRLEALIGPRTKAFLALDHGTELADAARLRAIAASSGATMVRDAAHAFGSSQDGVPVGAEPGICVFSFDPVKSLTAIDAGVLVLDGPEQRQRAHELRLLGSDQPASVMYQNARTWDYDAVGIGFRYHVSNVHGALGAHQLTKLDEVRRNRQSACRRYAERLKGLDVVIAPTGDFLDVCPFTYVVRVPPDARDGLRAHLSELGIDTGLHWRPLQQHSFFSDSLRGPLPVIERVGDEIVSLPLHSSPMPDEMIDRVCEAITSFFASPTRAGQARAGQANEAVQRA